jgi:hypothetical protein
VIDAFAELLGKDDKRKNTKVAVAPGANVTVGAVINSEPAAPAVKDEAAATLQQFQKNNDEFAQILMEAANKPMHNPTILATGSAPDGAPVRPLAAGPRIGAQPAQLGG